MLAAFLQTVVFALRGINVETYMLEYIQVYYQASSYMVFVVINQY